MSKLEGKRVLITGGTGSLGRAIVRRLLAKETDRPTGVTVFSRDEFKQHEMRQEYPDKALQFVIGDIGRYSSVAGALQNADIVFHTAALKQVGACEENIEAAISTNIGGAQNIVRAIRELRLPVSTVVGVSSDKGQQPVNVYGVTKYLQERILVNANRLCPSTRFICICYGNVMASRGSVITVFQERIRQGKPLTINDPSMTRFLISLDQAVDALLEAVENALPGEVYVPQKLPAAKIGDIANALIGERIIEKCVIGMRPYEKMHETLIPQSDTSRTLTRNGYYVISPDEQLAPALRKAYVSSDYVVSRLELREIFEREGLLV